MTDSRANTQHLKWGPRLDLCNYKPCTIERLSNFFLLLSCRTLLISNNMPTCPVCDQEVDADQVAFEHHVNAHFEDGGHDPVAATGSDDRGDVELIGQTR